MDASSFLSKCARIAFRVALFGLLVSLCCASNRPRDEAARTLWVDDSHADFNRGRMSASARNLYVTHAGSLKQVFHYDLNHDGWADLLFNSAHDFILAPPVTLADLRGDAAIPDRELPGIGARILKADDFDGDERTDLLVIEQSRWVNTRNYLHLYWGTDSGEWNQTLQTDLLAENAMDVESLDCDGDGWTDIVVLLQVDHSGGAGTSRRMLRIYWGSDAGFLQGNSTDLAAPDIDEIERLSRAGPLLALGRNATTSLLKTLALAGRQKLVVNDYASSIGKIGDLRVHETDAGPVILASSEPGTESQADPTTSRASRSWSRIVRLLPADDGSLASIQSPPLAHSTYFWSPHRPDLLLLSDVSKAENSARLLVDFDLRTMQFGASRDLPQTAYVSGIALAHASAAPVIALAQLRNEESYDTQSWILPLEDALRGSGSDKTRRPVRTNGAAGVVELRPAKADPWREPRLAFLNRISGSYVERLPTMIYWGSPDGFSSGRRRDIPFHSGILGAGTDIDDDGRSDLVLVSQVHNVHSPKPYMGLHVYPGKNDGTFAVATILEEYGVRGLALADLDRDGWLDLVGSILHGPAEHRGWVLWRGGADGFSRSRRNFISFPGAHGLPAIADVDSDGWLDVAVPSMRGNEIRIFRSQEGEFDSTRFESVVAFQANQLDFADLNADGYIDLVSAAGLGPGTFFRDYGLQIFWGGADGYRSKRSQRLPAHGAVGFLIQDWDQDGHLDLFAPNYHSGITREGTSARIYWGSASGLDPGRYTYLPVDGAAGAFAMDFDGNGTLDIALSSHTTDGSHHTQSPIYYNGDGRFGEPLRRVLLPTTGPQQMYSSGAGDQYSRKHREWFESAVIPLNGVRRVRITATSQIPRGAALRLSFRAAASENELNGAAWQPAEIDEWHPAAAGAAVLQYRIDFIASWRDARYAELERVEVVGR